MPVGPGLRRNFPMADVSFVTSAAASSPAREAIFELKARIGKSVLGQVGMAGEQTAIGDAIGLSIKAFEASKAQQKMLILLTDGNDTASRVPPAHAADIAQQRGLAVYTIGVGNPDASGENRVDLATLRAVASTTGGRFFRAENGGQLERIYADIDALAPVKLQTETWRPKVPLFQWPLGAATLLGLAAWLLLLMRGVAARRSRHA